MDRDRRGRKRTPDQLRGLRPLHPLLPEQWNSRVVRVAMSEEDWARLEHLVQLASAQSPTLARAYGLTISRLLNRGDAETVATDAISGPLDWMDWERRKTLRLLFSKR
ncbi:MAG: hypothetical protein NVSMB14_10400 [Isosphaeraceae bacterium]